MEEYGILWAIETGIARGMGLSGLLLALGISLEGLIFLALVQAGAFLIAHLMLRGVRGLLTST